MTQLHCYVPDRIADLFKQKAKKANLSTSKYLALLVKKETAGQWPDNYFDLVGSWQGEPSRGLNRWIRNRESDSSSVPVRYQSVHQLSEWIVSIGRTAFQIPITVRNCRLQHRKS